MAPSQLNISPWGAMGGPFMPDFVPPWDLVKWPCLFFLEITGKEKPGAAIQKMILCHKATESTRPSLGKRKNKHKKVSRVIGLLQQGKVQT